jgi:hypothetical protein
MRTRSFRRHQAFRHGMRRLKEDRNQHYDDLSCACWTDPFIIARFREQPQMCSCWMCGHQRLWHGPRIQELRHMELDISVDFDDTEPLDIPDIYSRDYSERMVYPEFDAIIAAFVQ